MTFRFKHIASRFIFQSIITILAIGILMGTLFFSNYRKKDTIKATIISEIILSDINNTPDLIDKAINSHKNDSRFVPVNANSLIESNNDYSKSIGDSLLSISELQFLKTYSKESARIDSLKHALDIWIVAYEKYVLSLKELGNKDAGAVNLTINSISKLSNELYRAPDDGMQYASLRSLTSDFITTYSYNSIDMLVTFAEEVSNKYYMYEEFDGSVIEQYASELLSNLIQCKEIVTRIKNPSNSHGQHTDVVNASKKLRRFAHLFSLDIHQQIRSYTRWWNAVLIILALLLTLIYVIILTLISQKLSANTRIILENSSKLTEGDFTSEINNESNFEFIKINEKLEEIRLYITKRNSYVTNILENNFDKTLKVKGERDFLSKNLISLKERLSENAEKQAKQDAANETRRYINEGIAQFADIMRINSNNTVVLGDNLVKEFVKYIGALQGGLFINNEDNSDELNLISAFAFDRKKYMSKTLKKGEGLVGTCAMEMKTINLAEIPKDYTVIKSGLGDAPPSNILIVPVKYEEKLVGVLELASMKMFSETDIELTEQIASNLASTIITVRNNTKTAQLLEKSQQQAAEMREQEEEMRQNMEELKATQEESTRREDDLQGLIDAVGAGFYLIEYNTDGKIDNINSRVSTFLEQTYDAIIGRKHQEIFSENSVIDMSVIEDVVKTKSAKKIKEVLSWGSKKYLYHHTLSPIMAKSNDVIKILNLITIEEQENDQL